MRTFFFIGIVLSATTAHAQDYGVGAGINTFLKMRQYQDAEHSRRESDRAGRESARADIAVGKALVLDTATDAPSPGSAPSPDCAGGPQATLRSVATNIVRANPGISPEVLVAAVRHAIGQIAGLGCSPVCPVSAQVQVQAVATGIIRANPGLPPAPLGAAVDTQIRLIKDLACIP